VTFRRQPLAASPFFAYFLFFLFCTTLRWGWCGVLWTALSALATFLGMGIVAAQTLQDPEFEPDRFIIRGVYLGVVASLLAYLGLLSNEVAYKSIRALRPKTASTS
jgi:hypothetical protein